MSGHTRTPSVQSGWSQSTSTAATTAGSRGSNSLSDCVYAGRDPWTHGWRQPTSRDIPQVTLPRVPAVEDSTLNQYVAEVQGFEIPREGNSRQDLQSLETVPAMFFSEHFHLDNPRVFDAVIEDSQTATFDSAILQEKLSWYIDTVELHLIDRISNASSTFFSATAQFNDIQDRSNELSSGLMELKRTLEIVSTHSIKKACLSVELARKLSDVQRLMASVRQLGLAVEKLDDLEHISESGDMASFLDHVDVVEKLIVGKENRWLQGEALVDLSRLGILQPRLKELGDAKLKAGRFYVEELKSCLIGDLHRHVASVPVSETLARLGRGIAGSKRSSDSTLENQYLVVDDSLREAVKTILHGSIRAHTTELAVAEYRDAATREIKTLIRDSLPSQPNDERFESSQSSHASDRAASAAALALRLRDLSSDDSEKMVKQIYASLSEALRRLATHQKLLLDLTSSMGAPPVDLGDLLVSVIKSSDTRVLKILKVRKDQTARLLLTKFVRFYALTSMFMAECEAICGVQTIELATFLVAQTKLFFFTKYSNDEEMLQRSLNNDVWKKEEIPRSFQQLIDEIQEAATLDPASWLSILSSAALPLEPASHTETKTSPLNLFIGNESYFLSKSAIFLLGLCHDYLRLICVFPHYSQDLTHNLLELLRLYNMRTSQLILGAGATKTAGLKHIYVKHMAMAYESLRAVAGIMPAMQRVVDRHCSTGISRDFDGLINAYGDHQHEIHVKFVSLMTDKSSYYCRAIANVDWAKKPEPVNKYMLDLIKDTTSIARVLEDILPSSESLAILSEIFDVYKPRLLEAYFAIRLETYEEKENLMRDISEFRERLGAISGIGNVAEVLYQTVDNFSAPDLNQEQVLRHAETKFASARSIPQYPSTEVLPDTRAKIIESGTVPEDKTGRDNTCDTLEPMENQSLEVSKPAIEEPGTDISANNYESSIKSTSPSHETSLAEQTGFEPHHNVEEGHMGPLPEVSRQNENNSLASESRSEYSMKKEIEEDRTPGATRPTSVTQDKSDLEDDLTAFSGTLKDMNKDKPSSPGGVHVTEEDDTEKSVSTAVPGESGIVTPALPSVEIFNSLDTSLDDAAEKSDNNQKLIDTSPSPSAANNLKKKKKNKKKKK
ncbi:Vacuolar protein sorting-associated protein 54 [Wickerhamiella sorbophila]|uniref:Vacuolar protein sorting-associated protein 54 n=1 Tax=Wickerhamiella sorbophila TaxID=45607 RepID=A0A2T0FEL4_9ASCO|nr:Vacuolar protein sorting-associated protein 54 [Wickerhamiella sorbophila]PRT53442.1 Vacuolar protein sorting-associated protein 54 [Wickerhamiella sorbophila]